jgi:hypothetical protein
MTITANFPTSISKINIPIFINGQELYILNKITVINLLTVFIDSKGSN